MVRTVISLDEEDKEWLDRASAERGVSMTELVRVAVRRLRSDLERGEPSYEALLRQTQGLWRRGDGLEWQDKLRNEW
jgi:hypothetical protein